MAAKVRVTMDVSPEFKKLIEKLAQQTESGSQTDVIRRAIQLYDLAVEAKAKGEELAIVKDDVVKARIVAL